MKKKELMFVLIVTFIVIVIWVIADIIHTRPSQQLDSQLQTALEPITPTFDNKTLDKINNIKTIPFNVPITVPTPTPTPLPKVSPTPTPVPTPLPPTPSPSSTASSSASPVPSSTP